MATRLETMRALSEATMTRITYTPDAWMQYLDSAAWLYKYHFHDQLLIYAQRPDARACAPIELWNKTFQRWVNKGAKGIALIDDTGDRPRLRYVFDVSDTNTRSDIPVKLWELESRWQKQVIEELSNRFGDVEQGGDYPHQLLDIVRNAVMDNIADYAEVLQHIVDGSELAGLSDDERMDKFVNTVYGGVAYSVLTRAGYNPGMVLTLSNFLHVQYFDTPMVASQLGCATGDISEMILRQMERSIRGIERQERDNIAKLLQNRDNDVESKKSESERGDEHGTHLQAERGLSDPELDAGDGNDGNVGQVRQDAQAIHEGAPEGDLQRDAADEQPANAFIGDRQDGEGADRADRAADGGSGRRDGELEGDESDGMGTPDERASGAGGRSGDAGADSALDRLPTVEEQIERIEQAGANEAPAFISPTTGVQGSLFGAEASHSAPIGISQQVIDEILCDGSNEHNSPLRICAWMKADRPIAENAAFLQNEYGTGGKGFVIDDIRVAAWFDADGIRLAVGESVIEAGESVLLTWEQVAARVRELLDLGRYLPQSRLLMVDINERDELAELICYLQRECLTDFFIEPEAFRGSFPEDKARVSEMLHQPERLAAIRDGMDALVQAYRDNPGVLRMSYRKMDELQTRLSHLAGQRLTFQAEELDAGELRRFITKDEVDAHLIGGDYVSDSKLSTYAFFLQPHTVKEKATFLKNEYGFSGISHLDWYANHDSSGMTLSRGSIINPYDKVHLKWPAVARRIDELIAAKRYMRPNEIAYIPEYEKQQLSRLICGFFENRMEEQSPFPNGVDYYDRIKMARGYLDEPARVEEILDYMRVALQGEQENLNRAAFDKKAYESLLAFSQGRFALFGQDAAAFVAESVLDDGHEQDAVTTGMGDEEPNAPMDEERDVAELVDSREYAYVLGDQATIGDTTYTIVGITQDTVTLNDANYPLLFEEMDRELFERRLQESPDNDGLIVPTDAAMLHDTEPILSSEELYEHFAPVVVRAVSQDALYRNACVNSDEENAYIECMAAIGRATAHIDSIQFARLFYDDADFTERLQTEVWDRTYAFLRVDVSEEELDPFAIPDEEAETDEVDDFPDIDTEAVREALASRATAGDEMLEQAERIAADTAVEPYERFSVREYGGGFGVWDDIRNAFYMDDTGIAQSFETEVEAEAYRESVEKSVSEQEAAEWMYVERSKQEAPEAPVLSNDNLIGKYLTIGDRRYEIERVSDISGDVSMRDITFHSEVGFPINRVEKVGRVREWLKEQPEQQAEPFIPTWEKPPEAERRSTDIDLTQPRVEKHDFRITDDELGYGGPKAKYRMNVDAIRTLQNIEAERRLATPEEQEILSRYVGWGGVADAFDETKDNWRAEYQELRDLLTDEEYRSARESVLNAHYTSPTVIKAIYSAIEGMGFTTGNVLEPACGVGNFFGLVPDSMSKSKLYGVELDSITGRIAKQLYQNANIAIQGFEETNLPDSFFDLAVGNVPFGDYGIADKRYDKNHFLVHDYFFAKALDKVRPGGVVAFVTSSGTMDKKNSTVRKYIAQRAELLGAVRLPNNAFLQNAGTQVVADILFLQKRDRPIEIEPEWVHLGKTDGGLTINQYYVDNPDMVLGELTTESTQYGKQECTVRPIPGADLSEQLSDAMANIHGEIGDYIHEDELGENDGDSIPADPDVRNFSFAIVDGNIYYRENSLMHKVDVSVTAGNRIRGLIGLRDCTRRLIELQLEGYSDAAIERAQAQLNEQYDAFTKKYGLINSRGNDMAFSDDSSYCLLCSLEVLDEEGNLARKADMFTKRTIRQQADITHVDTASEALAVSLSERAKVDVPYMSELTGMSEEQIASDLAGVIFRNPMFGNGNASEEEFLTADEYLSGKVREKLAWARRSAELYPEDYSAHVAALEKVQPKDLTAAEIDVRLGATWIPPEIVQQFMYELFQTSGWGRSRMHVLYSKYTANWSITEKRTEYNSVAAKVTYGTKRANGYEILEQSLNLRDVRIFDTVTDADGKEQRVLNKKETVLAQQKQQLIKDAFSQWIWNDPARREQLCALYNERFNNLRSREYDGSHIRFVGMNPEIELRQHQKDSVARILYGGNALLAHVVGAGKTFAMTAAAMESKRLGLSQKSMFVVPNHLTEQWAAEFLQLYPSANILVATKRDFEKSRRRKFCSRIATGDYDAVIIGHSQFEKIPLSVERQQRLLEEQIEEIMKGIAEAKAAREERFTIKQMERSRKHLEVKLKKLNDTSRKDNVINYEELGVDKLFVDEAHFHKNLAAYTKMRNVAGISQTEAQKSSDLFMKCRYMDELTGGRGIVFATGTPVSNSMVEMFTMQRYLQYGMLQQSGLHHFDAWASTFGETVTAIELAPEGNGYRAKTRFARFFNLPELIAMFKQAADIKTSDMLSLPVPEVEYHNEQLDASDIQTEMVRSLGERAERVRNRLVDPSQDNMLTITNDGRKLALDQRLINPALPDDPNSKVNVCMQNVFRVWESTQTQRSAQLVFCDLSTPKGDGSFNVYDDIRNKLIAQGIPEHEIAYIHDANTETRKVELFGKVRSGQVRVLLGSTAKMGAGTNVQRLLVAEHHLDIPWRPSDLEQREGRAIRQGNTCPTVHIFRYVTKNTFDSYMWQTLENKQKFIGQIMTSKSPVRSCEDVDETALTYAEVKALATGDERIKEKMDLEVVVSRLKLVRANYLSQKYSMEDALLKHYPQEICRKEERIKGYEADIALRDSHMSDGFPGMEIGGVRYEDKKDVGTALLSSCKAMTSPEQTKIGSYRGFDLFLSFDTFGKTFRATLQGALSHFVDLGDDVLGNIQRLDNSLHGMPERLASAQEQLADLRKQRETAEAEVQKPFPQEQELNEKAARLAELDAALNIGSGHDASAAAMEDEIPAQEEEIPEQEERTSIRESLQQYADECRQQEPNHNRDTEKEER